MFPKLNLASLTKYFNSYLFLNATHRNKLILHCLCANFNIKFFHVKKYTKLNIVTYSNKIFFYRKTGFLAFNILVHLNNMQFFIFF